MIEVITLTPISNQRYVVRFSNDHELKSTASAVSDHNISTGKQLTQEAYEAFLWASALGLTKQRAGRILSHRAMSRKELIDKLVEKGELLEHAHAAADWLEELGVLDDTAYGGMLVRHYSAKRYGRDRIKHELYRRGVPKEFWEDCLQEMPEMDDEIDLLLQRKLGGTLPDYKEKKRAFDFLRRRGFSWSEISEAFSRYEENLEE